MRRKNFPLSLRPSNLRVKLMERTRVGTSMAQVGSRAPTFTQRKVTNMSHKQRISSFAKLAILTAGVMAMSGAYAQKAYLEITMKVDPQDRPAAAAIYTKYKSPFLTKVAGAQSKELLIRDEDVQVLHGFSSASQAQAYLKSELFNKDVVIQLGPLLKAAPEVRIYTAN